MLLVEELAARGWPAAETLRRDGWLLRHTPSLTRRRSNSALPVCGDRGDLACVEDFYARRGARALVQVSPAEERTGSTPSSRAGAGRRGGHRRPRRRADAVLAATAPGDGGARRPARRGLGGGVGGLRGAPGRRRARPRRPRAHRARDGIRPGHRRPRRRAGGVRARLGGPVLRGHRRERAPARRRGPRGPRLDDVGRRARRAAPLSPGRERQRASTRLLRARWFRALTRLSLQGGPRRGAAV